MQWLNGRYAQEFNHRHGFDGHLFQGRFYSGQVESDWHLLELSRYLARNPVEPASAGSHGEWTWGSYRAVAGFDTAPPRFLDVRRVLEHVRAATLNPRELAFGSFVEDPPGRPQA